MIESYYSYDHDSFHSQSALSVDNNTWSKAHSEFGVDANLFGIPIGANYKDYHETATSLSYSRRDEVSSEVVHAQMRIGLGDNSTKAYLACIEAIRDLSGSNLSIAKYTETSNVVAVEFNWQGIGKNAGPLKLNWTTEDESIYISTEEDRKEIPQGKTGFQFRRANSDQLVTINGDGRTVSFVIAAPCQKDCGSTSRVSCTIKNLKQPLSLTPQSSVGVVCPNMTSGEYYFSAKIPWVTASPGVRTKLNVSMMSGNSGTPAYQGTFERDVMDVALRQPSHLPDTIEIANQRVTVQDGDVEIVINSPDPFADIVYLQPVYPAIVSGPDLTIELRPRLN